MVLYRLVDNLITDILNEKSSSKNMAKAERRQSPRTIRKTKLNEQKRGGERNDKFLSAHQLTNEEYRPRPSRWYKDEHANDEQQLAAIALTIMIGGLIILALHYSGVFETIMYKAANIISFII